MLTTGMDRFIVLWSNGGLLCCWIASETKNIFVRAIQFQEQLLRTDAPFTESSAFILTRVAETVRFLFFLKKNARDLMAMLFHMTTRMFQENIVPRTPKN